MMILTHTPTTTKEHMKCDKTIISKQHGNIENSVLDFSVISHRDVNFPVGLKKLGVNVCLFDFLIQVLSSYYRITFKKTV